jgi:hypothetical protein
MLSPRTSLLLATAAFEVALVAGCARPHGDASEGGVSSQSSASPGGADSRAPAAATGDAPRQLARPPKLTNRIAYIPAQCFTKTRASGADTAKNPCYVCHSRAEPPNYTSDQEVQRKLSFPFAAKTNPWTNLFDPPVLRTSSGTDEAILAYVRRSNYFDDRGNIVLAQALGAPPLNWDANKNGRWDGFTPDMWFRFDERGFDHRPDGSMSGWRAFAYYPFPGTFFPTNGSADDVAIRLDPVLRQDKEGRFDPVVYELNLAIVEALIRRTDVVIDPVEEAPLGVDLDLDGHIGRATRVAFDGAPDHSGRTRMHYVGMAHEKESASFFPIAPGLFPLGTEFFHTVRYLDIGSDGVVAMAARMKEVRYARKVRWASYEIARANMLSEAQHQDESPDGTHDVEWVGEEGVFTRTWLLQGFIEDRDGSLRPQTFEETASCPGCHAGIGATTDGTFSFARKMGAAEHARGWFHWSQRDLRGIAEPQRADGQYEYTFYLLQAGAGDEFRENTEVLLRFFDERRALRSDEVAKLRRDISSLLLPSPERALALDRAYQAIVREQRFDLGRDVVLSPVQNVYRTVPLGEPTGIHEPAVSEPLVEQYKVPKFVIKTSRTTPR